MPGEGVIHDEDERRVYETDGLTAYRELPLVTVLPEQHGAGLDRAALLQENKVKVVPRRAGTSLSGGALPVADAILLGLGKFNRVLEIDFANRCAVARARRPPNLGFTHAVQGEGFYYAPDRRARSPALFGGNVAEIRAACTA